MAKSEQEKYSEHLNREALIAGLDLEPIKFKLVIDHDGPQWSRERAERAEAAYKQFLVLISRYPHERIVPLGDIDMFWHQHILDTSKYAEDCQNIFGRFVHHFPYFGLRGREDADALHQAGRRTAQLLAKEFGQTFLGNSLFPDCVTTPDPTDPGCAPIPSCESYDCGRIPTPLNDCRPRFDNSIHL
jgi:hypothetical protein